MESSSRPGSPAGSEFWDPNNSGEGFPPYGHVIAEVFVDIGPGFKVAIHVPSGVMEEDEWRDSIEFRLRREAAFKVIDWLWGQGRVRGRWYTPETVSEYLDREGI